MAVRAACSAACRNRSQRLLPACPTAAQLPAAALPPLRRSYDKRHGRGKMTFKRGFKYEGEWREDQAHGCGGRWESLVALACRQESGRLCCCGCCICCPDPSVNPSTTAVLVCVVSSRGRQGAAQYEDGGCFVGEFRENARCGWGTHYFPGGDKYEGEWARDRIHGGWGGRSHMRCRTAFVLPQLADRLHFSPAAAAHALQARAASRLPTARSTRAAGPTAAACRAAWWQVWLASCWVVAVDC